MSSSIQAKVDPKGNNWLPTLSPKTTKHVKGGQGPDRMWEYKRIQIIQSKSKAGSVFIL